MSLKLGQKLSREFTHNLLGGRGHFELRVVTGDNILHRDECDEIAKELHELADLFKNLRTPEDS